MARRRRRIAVCALGLLGALLGEATSTLDAGASGYTGSFADAVRQRHAEWPFVAGFVLLFNGPLAFAAFCAGLAAAAEGFLMPGSTAYRALRRRWPQLLAGALTFNGAYALAVTGALGDGAPASLAFSGLAIGGPCLASLYLIGIVEFVRRRGPTRSLTIAGRMSLSAYVAQGAIAGLIFNGYGLGLYGHVGDLACLALAVAIHAIANGLCAVWSRAVGPGRLERLLRMFTRGAGTARTSRHRT